MTEIMAIRIVLTLQSVYTCTQQDHHHRRCVALGEHRSRTSTFLASLPPSGVAYGTAYTLGIVIRVAEKTIGILLTMLLGLNPVHLSSHRIGLVHTNSIEQALPIQGLWCARLT